MELNKLKIMEIQNNIEEYEKIITKLVDKQVRLYCKDLDTYIKEISQILNNNEMDITDAFLESVILQLPKYMYWASEGQEALSLRADLAKTVKNEEFLKQLETCTGTVSKKNMEAELKILHENFAYIIYVRSANKINLRLKYAMELLQSAKKLLSKRIHDTWETSYTNDIETRYNNSKKKF